MTPKPLSLKTCVAAVTLMAAVFTLASSQVALGAELLPFPDSSYQSRAVDPQVYDQFRRRISGFDCQELNELMNRLNEKYQTAHTQRDKSYYRNS
ncbi:MAG: hypothetical protein WBG37_18975 [Desulfobacterales bacterium]